MRHLAIFALVAFLFACSEELPEQEEVIRPVKMMTVGGDAGGGELQFPGSVSAGQDAELAFEVPGRLVELPVEEGQQVAKGDEIARLDARDFQANLNAERARLNAAKAEYERTEALYASDAASKQDLEVARRNYEVAEAGVTTARKSVEDTRLRAPFAGTIARKLVENFQNVQAKQPVVLLTDETSLKVEIDIPESTWAFARGSLTDAQNEDNNLRVIVSSYPDREFPAKITAAATQADPVTRTYKLTLTFDPPDDIQIRPGMTAQARGDVPVMDPSGQRVLVPSRAVAANDDGSAYVWIVDSGTMQVSRRVVEQGQLSGDSVEITNGLAGGETIVTSGVFQLREGITVRRLED